MKCVGLRLICLDYSSELEHCGKVGPCLDYRLRLIVFKSMALSLTQTLRNNAIWVQKQPVNTFTEKDFDMVDSICEYFFRIDKQSVQFCYITRTYLVTTVPPDMEKGVGEPWGGRGTKEAMRMIASVPNVLISRVHWSWADTSKPISRFSENRNRNIDTTKSVI